MDRQQHRSFTRPTVSLKRHLITRCLPVVVAGFLLFWFMGGFPPTTWRLLIEVGLRAQDGGAHPALALLIAQALCLAAALSLFVWIAQHEFRMLALLLSQTHRQAASPVSSKLVSLIDTDRERSSRATTAPFPAFPPNGSSTPGRSDAFIALQSPRKETGLTNPFEPLEGSLSASDFRAEQLPAAQERQPRVDASARALPSNRQEHRLVASSDLLEETIVAEETIHYSTVLHELGFFQSLQIPVSQQRVEAAQEQEKQSHISQAPSAGEVKRQEQAEETSASRDPFDVQSGIFDLFPSEVFFGTSPDDTAAQANDQGIAGGTDEASAEQAQPAVSNDEAFVFGNPFEGPLPDVFQHDVDLKRSLMEQASMHQASRQR